jgi:hypothetical protein
VPTGLTVKASSSSHWRLERDRPSVLLIDGRHVRVFKGATRTPGNVPASTRAIFAKKASGPSFYPVLTAAAANCLPPKEEAS